MASQLVKPPMASLTFFFYKKAPTFIVSRDWPSQTFLEYIWALEECILVHHCSKTSLVHHSILVFLVSFESKVLYYDFVKLFAYLWEEESKCEVSLRDSQVWGITWKVVQEWSISWEV